jgi:hypothetical protein
MEVDGTEDLESRFPALPVRIMRCQRYKPL